MQLTGAAPQSRDDVLLDATLTLSTGGLAKAGRSADDLRDLARQFHRDESGAVRLLPPGRIGRVTQTEYFLPKELDFARDIAVFTGEDVAGPGSRSLPGIDGFIGGKPLSLKETGGGLVAVLKHASQAEKKALNAGYNDVQLFIDAPNVDPDQLLDFAQDGGLTQIPTQGTITNITIRTGNGHVRIVGSAP